ncbi:unnamed protein product [Clavelina lepadiformis]|uniref:Uncharacterized protein n=1 Tax=Clavelina lepadiformis TaxID=159417 RepID=A0ABP0G7D7_CLALP
MRHFPFRTGQMQAKLSIAMGTDDAEIGSGKPPSKLNCHRIGWFYFTAASLINTNDNVSGRVAKKRSNNAATVSDVIFALTMICFLFTAASLINHDAEMVQANHHQYERSYNSAAVPFMENKRT